MKSFGRFALSLMIADLPWSIHPFLLRRLARGLLRFLRLDTLMRKPTSLNPASFTTRRPRLPLVKFIALARRSELRNPKRVGISQSFGWWSQRWHTPL